MVTNVLESKSVQRLQGILQSRYGKNLEVRYMIDASTAAMGGEAHLNGSDLNIPIELHGIFLGLARIREAAELPKTAIQAITDVVRLILEPSLYSRYLENRAELHKQDFISHDDERFDEDADLHVVEQKAAVTTSVLLVSENPETLARVARIMHDDSDRWAFLSYKDMKCHLGSVDEIKALGKATIFIEDLLLVSPPELEVLNEYLKVGDIEQEPMIIIGSTRNFEQIKTTGHYSTELLNGLAPYVADLNRWPSEERLLKQALEMLIHPLAMSGI